MCDLFQANPWKPLLCTNCHQNRSGHQNIDKCEHSAMNSTSSMHLYEEIMAQYFTTNIDALESNTNEIIVEDDDDSFSDEEQELTKRSTIEFIQNQSMINTTGIVLIGPDLRSKEMTIKKPKKINLLKKSKSNADECLKKTDIIENNSSKLWWFKVKKANGSPIIQTESNKSNISNSTLTNQKIRVLPETNKLTLNEALNIARRQHSSPNPQPKLPLNNKPSNSLAVSNYGSSIASTTSSSTQSSTEYDTNLTREETTYLTAISPIEKNPSLIIMLDKTNKLTIERLTHDLRIIIDEYKQNLPVARFQTLKTFVNQYQLTKILSNEAIYFLLLQIIDEFSHNSILITTTFDNFLITYHSTIPILVPTTSSSIKKDEEVSIEEFIKNLAKKFFDSSSLPIFNDLSTFENLSYRYLSNQILQFSNIDLDNNNISMQRIKLLDLFWNKIQSLRNIQINEENERIIFALYYLMRYISQSDI